MRATAVTNVLASALFASFGAACATPPRLEPAPRADATPGVGVGAADVEAGVSVEARARAWSGTPANLREQVTPVLVTITNGSAVPVRVRYNEFALVAADGTRFAAIPPYSMEGAVTQPVTAYAYPVSGFTVAPYLAPYYPGAPVVGSPWTYDPLYYSTYYAALRQVQLPTADMVRRALPEGWLAPGGSVGGFVYFQSVGDGTERVTFRADLVNANTAAQFATISIPFTVSEGD